MIFQVAERIHEEHRKWREREGHDMAVRAYARGFEAVEEIMRVAFKEGAVAGMREGQELDRQNIETLSACDGNPRTQGAAGE